MSAADRARASRISQGLPPTVEDVVVLAKVARLVVGSRQDRAGRG